MNVIAKLFKNRLYYNERCGLMLKRLSLLNLDLQANDFYYNGECCIYMSKVVPPNSSSTCQISKSRLAESEWGLDAKDCGSFQVTDTEILKNKCCGISITDTANSSVPHVPRILFSNPAVATSTLLSA